MLDRMKSIGEDFSNPRSAIVHLIYDGKDNEYVRIGADWHFLGYLTDGTKNTIDEWRPQIDYLSDLVECHRDGAKYLIQRVTSDTTEFQNIVVFSHVSIAVFLKDALSLIQIGSLASSLLLYRPVVEILMEMQYLKRFPNEMESYYSKVEKLNKQTAGGKTIARPKGSLRFKKIEYIIKSLRIHNKNNPNSYEKGLIERWQLLSNAAAHPSPELLSLSQQQREWDWRNILGELEGVTSSAIEQLFKIDKELKSLIDQEQDLNKKLTNLFSYGTTASPLD